MAQGGGPGLKERSHRDVKRAVWRDCAGGAVYTAFNVALSIHRNGMRLYHIQHLQVPALAVPGAGSGSLAAYRIGLAGPHPTGVDGAGTLDRTGGWCCRQSYARLHPALVPGPSPDT